jgi:hypothetical protein
MRVPRSIHRFLNRLSPYQSLLILAIPLAIVEPLKLIALTVLGVVSEKGQNDRHPKGGRHEVVLVVEDNTDVRSATVSLLRELGYRTVEADSAASALSKINEGTRVDIVFSDIVLPGSMAQHWQETSQAEIRVCLYCLRRGTREV